MKLVNSECRFPTAKRHGNAATVRPVRVEMYCFKSVPAQADLGRASLSVRPRLYSTIACLVRCVDLGPDKLVDYSVRRCNSTVAGMCTIPAPF